MCESARADTHIELLCPELRIAAPDVASLARPARIATEASRVQDANNCRQPKQKSQWAPARIPFVVPNSVEKNRIPIGQGKKIQPHRIPLRDRLRRDTEPAEGEEPSHSNHASSHLISSQASAALRADLMLMLMHAAPALASEPPPRHQTDMACYSSCWWTEACCSTSVYGGCGNWCMVEVCAYHCFPPLLPNFEPTCGLSPSSDAMLQE